MIKFFELREQSVTAYRAKVGASPCRYCGEAVDDTNGKLTGEAWGYVIPAHHTCFSAAPHPIIRSKTNVRN